MKTILISVGFAVFWTAFMVWWSSDFSIVHVVIMSVMGLILGFSWTWFMRRFGYIA